jgi:hypothetical protein
VLPDCYEYLIQKARQQDLVREVAGYRLARSVTGSQRPIPPIRGASKQLVCKLPVLGTVLCQTT